eukprot:Protomagalhaensia_wolfi_Nauph_80__3514@NODE_3564_length_767_cov_2_576923_g2798_i0_p2_GENE_NODE_3564_length_767_cov_2_576923_g2798_i0NODE_3564_length_767_cov_2_576923_g2798_i0_p2_ORF_typecomplete_len113_score1_98T2SSF/PF00482_23/0_14_NODE_3564_length_767_cov_2_576923_g2798_i0395733
MQILLNLSLFEAAQFARPLPHPQLLRVAHAATLQPHFQEPVRRTRSRLSLGDVRVVAFVPCFRHPLEVLPDFVAQGAQIHLGGTKTEDWLLSKEERPFFWFFFGPCLLRPGC